MDSLISPQDYGLYFKDTIEDDKKLIQKFLTPKEWEWVQHLLLGFYKLTEAHPFTLKVTHSDLLSEHILIDKNSHKLSGIIDFSLRIADPANDFKVLDQYGEKFLRTVYENYPPVDEYFEMRRKFYSSDIQVANLYQSVERQDALSLQKHHLKDLKNHIATRPLA